MNAHSVVGSVVKFFAFWRKSAKHSVDRGLLCLPAKGDHDESSDTRRNRCSRGVVVRFTGGGHVTNESLGERPERRAGPRRFRGRIWMGRRLQGIEEERICR